MGDAWARVDREVTQQGSLGHAYLAHPSGDLRLALREANRSLAAALDYLGWMLAAMDAGDTALARSIHERPVHPAYATLQHKIRAFADREQQEVTETCQAATSSA